MPYRKPRSWGNVKPPVGTVVNKSHPLAQQIDGAWLLNEHSGIYLRDAAQRAPASGKLNGPSPFWASNPLRGLVFDASAGSYASLDLVGNYTSDNFSIASSFVVDSLTDSPVLAWKGAFQVSGWYVQIVSDGSIQLVTNQAGVFQSTQTSAGVIATGTQYTVVMTRSGASAHIFLNGVENTYQVVGTHINPVTSAAVLQLGAYNLASTNRMQGKIIWYAQWRNRVLTQSDAMTLTTQPYAFYQRPVRRIISAALIKAALNADGVGQAAFTGGELDSAHLNADGAASAAIAGAQLVSSALNADGLSAAAFSANSLISHPFNADGSSSATFSTNALAGGTLNADGAASVAVTGSISPPFFMAAGTSTVNFVGGAAESSSLTANGGATCGFASQRRRVPGVPHPEFHAEDLEQTIEHEQPEEQEPDAIAPEPVIQGTPQEIDKGYLNFLERLQPPPVRPLAPPKDPRDIKIEELERKVQVLEAQLQDMEGDLLLIIGASA